MNIGFTSVVILLDSNTETIVIEQKNNNIYLDQKWAGPKYLTEQTKNPIFNCTELSLLN